MNTPLIYCKDYPRDKKNQFAGLLQSKLKELCAKSSGVKILVSFFYFSGIKTFYNSLRENPDITLRILVGADTEQIAGRVVECFLSEKDDFGTPLSYTDNEIRERYLNSLRNIAASPEFDKKIFYERIGFFLEMLRKDRIIIRKTTGEHREKLFIFDGGKEKGLFENPAWMTGSSNLTMPGLDADSDVDMITSDCGSEEVDALFEFLWDSSVTLTEDPPTKQAILDIFEQQSMVSPVTPYEAYILALKTYLELQKQTNASEYVNQLLERSGFKKYRYQIDAVNQALNILEEYNGVILADVVGLGKSVIGSLIAAAMPKRGRGIIIAPPGLIGDEGRAKGGWRDYANQFRLNWEIFSCGKLEAALEYCRSNPDIEAVIVDEAHRFKNQDTQDYELLSHICRGKKVILLTATPFNNRPADIFSLLKLFIVPGRCKITLDNQLTNRFGYYDQLFRALSEVQKYHHSPEPDKRKKVENSYRKLKRQFDEEVVSQDDVIINLSDVRRWSQDLAQEIRHILEPVIIRRNRIDLRNDPDYRDEVTELSDMMPPVEQFFELSKEQSRFYDQVLNFYFSENGKFKGAIYRPFIYEQKLTGSLDAADNREMVLQSNLYDFMRRLLVHRFESSFGAFAQSLQNFLSIHQKALAFIERTGKFILDRKLLEKIYNSDDAEIAEALAAYETMLNEATVLPKNNKIYELDTFASKDEFLQDIRNDIALFEELIKIVEDLELASNDPKAECLANAIKAVLDGKHVAIPVKCDEPVRKIIVFSEYADTIRHLEKYLEQKFSGKIAVVYGTVSAALADSIEANFDASYKKTQQNKFQILLATDKMSEGHNLNRAGLVINYDIPWNPTRVIQRVGRINRIGKKVFQQLYIFNFFPTEQGATIAKSREIAAAKMFMIHNTIGEDARIFDIDETPSASSLYHKLQQNPEESEQESFLTTAKKEFLAAKQEHPEVIRKISKLPGRVKTARKTDADGLLLFKQKGLALFCLHIDYENKMREMQIPIEAALKAMKCPFDEQKLDLSNDFWTAYDKAGKFQETFADGAKNIQSIEHKAVENLNAAIEFCENSHLFEKLPFLRTLLKDITQYGSLPDYTLRKLATYDIVNYPNKMDNFLTTVQALQNILGGDYLQRLQSNLGYKISEIIIAEELQSHS